MNIKLFILTLPTKILTPSKAFKKLEGAVLYWLAPIFTNAVFSVFGVVLFSTMFWLTKPYPVRCGRVAPDSDLEKKKSNLTYNY